MALDTTTDLGELRVSLRRDLFVRAESFAGEQCFILEDRDSSRFLRMGVREYAFASLLDGRLTVSEVVQRLARRAGADALDEHDALTVCHRLVEGGMAEVADRWFVGDSSNAPARRLERSQRLHPLIVKVPLIHPNRWFQTIAEVAQRVPGRFALLGWLLLVALGCLHAWVYWQELSAATPQVVAPNEWLWMAVAWSVLKLIHESAHGIACCSLGGRVREGGLMIVLLAPIPYLDVTSVWRLSSKWQRTLVAAAGMMAELAIAAVAVVIACHTEDDLVRRHACHLALVGSLATLLFNLNVLVRFDGYYILSDLIDVPNLSQSGRLYVRGLVQRIVLGSEPLGLHQTGWRGQVVRAYGVAALVWRALVCFCLLAAAQALFHGAGVVLAFAAACVWLGRPFRSCIDGLVRHWRAGPTTRRRLLIGSAGVAAVCLAPFTIIPAPAGRGAPLVVDHLGRNAVHAGAAGWIEELHVTIGQSVRCGQPLVVLSNRELIAEHRDLCLQLAAAQIRAQTFLDQENIAAQQLENQLARQLSTRIAESRRRMSELTIRAPSSGVVIGRDLASQAGRYVARGQLLFSVVPDADKRVRAWIAPEDLAALNRVALQCPFRLHDQPLRQHQCRLVKIEPMSSSQISHPAVTSLGGGDLVVTEAEATVDRQRPDPSKWELLKPRLLAEFAVREELAEQIRIGQTGKLHIGRPRGLIGFHCYDLLRSWFRGRTATLTEARAAVRGQYRVAAKDTQSRVARNPLEH